MLRKAFQHDPYPTSASIELLAQQMDLSPKTVINWFHNHRMRSKQQNRDENGKRINGVYIKQEAHDSNSMDGSQHAAPSPDSSSIDPLSPAADRNSATASGRKRKSAHPQYVRAGAVLNKHNDYTEEEASGSGGATGEEQTAPDSVADDGAEPIIDVDGLEEAPNKIVKLEQGVKADDLRWEADTDRAECVQKLESGITQNSDDWEF